MPPRRFLRIILPALFALILPITTFSQSPAPRDLRAIAILQQSFAAMGGNLPAPVVATGTVAINKGPSTETGTVRISIRGFDQNTEDIQAGGESFRLIQSRGRSSDRQGKLHSLERTVNSDAFAFPLQIIARTLADSNFGLEYVELDTSSGNPEHRVRIWQTFPGKPRLQPLEEVSKKDIWIDAASNLPTQLKFTYRTARGPGSVAFPVEWTYSSFKREAGILYPSRIEKRINGNLWGTFEINAVVLDSGLTDSDFKLR